MCPADKTENCVEEKSAQTVPTSRSPQGRAAFNKVVNELKKLIYEEKQRAIQTLLASQTATDAMDYSLWRATKRLKQTLQNIPPSAHYRRGMDEK
jgi:CHASE3 domain sensor protein